MVAAEEGWIAPFTAAVYHLEFAAGCDISQVSTLERAVALAASENELSLDFAGVFGRSQDEIFKARLREQTQAAQGAEIFGAPTFKTADGELFWGDDRLDQAIAWAGRL